MMEKENTFIGKDDLIHCSVCKEHVSKHGCQKTIY